MNLQTNSSTSALAGMFAALSDPHRLSIVERLVAEGEKTVGELAAPFDISGPAISRHLSVLESAGLIERRVERQWRICRVRRDALDAVGGWVEQQRRFWNASIDRLERHLEENPGPGSEGGEG
jgi:DNA-binding transcriptional ArsR family regulator